MKNKALETIAKYNLIDKNDIILACVSGGADSMALVSFLFDLQTNGYFKQLFVCHVNHGLRGEDSLNDESFVLSYCKQNQIEHFLLRSDVGKKAKAQKKSIELCAREVRYNFFAHCCNLIRKKQDENASIKISTAHTLSDNAETVLLNFIRGTTIKGLCGIPVTRNLSLQSEDTPNLSTKATENVDLIIRPLLFCTREQIEEYCKVNNISFVIDKTNLCDDYTRNNIRHNIIPVINSINPSFYKVLEKNLDSYNADYSFLNRYSQSEFKKVCVSGENLLIDTKKFVKLDVSIQKRVLSLFLQHHGVEVTALKIKHLMDIIENNETSYEVKKDTFAKLEKQMLMITKSKDTIYYNPQELVNGAIIFDKYSIHLNIINNINKNLNNFSKKALFVNMDYDKIKGTIKIRQRENGDKITLSNRKITKSLKKLFNENKIPVSKRDEIAVLHDDFQIIALIGEEFTAICDDVKITDQTSNIIVVEFELI